MIPPGLLALGVLAPLALSPAPGARNALRLFDTYLAREASTAADYRADLQPGGDPANLRPGRRLGRSPILGPFTYRPKTYAELSRPQRHALLRDPRFHAFVARVRRRENPSPSGRWVIAPEEILSRRPWLMTAPSR